MNKSETKLFSFECPCWAVYMRITCLRSSATSLLTDKLMDRLMEFVFLSAWVVPDFNLFMVTLGEL